MATVVVYGALLLEISAKSKMSFFNLTHTGVQDPFKTAAHAKTDAQSQVKLQL